MYLFLNFRDPQTTEEYHKTIQIVMKTLGNVLINVCSLNLCAIVFALKSTFGETFHYGGGGRCGGVLPNPKSSSHHGNISV